MHRLDFLITGILILRSLDASPINDLYNDKDTLSSTSEESKVRERQKRSFIMSHNYAEEVYKHLNHVTGAPGPWRQQNCSTTYNCEQVSPHHCNTKVVKHFFCSNNQIVRPCSIDFHFNIYDTNVTFRGIDLVLYKASEPKAKNDVYYVYILVSTSSISNRVLLAGFKIVEASCSSWQMFHLNNEIVSDFIHEGANILSFELLVFDDVSILTCEAVHSLFLLSTDAYNISPTPQISTTPEGGSGGREEMLEPPNTESILSTTEAPAGENSDKALKITNPFSLPDEKLSAHVPMLNVFAEKLSKRDADYSRDVLDPLHTYTEKNWCQLVDKVIHLESTVRINNKTFNVIAPKGYYIVKECRANTKILDGVDEKDCVPRRQKPLELLVSRWRGGKRQAFIYKSSEVKMTQECG